MDLTNRDGETVDPMPWFVSVSLAFMVVFSIGPIYLDEYGVDLMPSLLICAGIVIVWTVITYWRYVYTLKPDLIGEVPVEVRLERLFYAIIAGVLILFAISLPIVWSQ